MDATRRVLRMPLTALWTGDGETLRASKVRDLRPSEARALVRSRPDLELVVAYGGEPLQWLYGDEKWRFWKEELFPRILETNPDGPTIIDDTVPGYYHFEVSEWQLVGSDRPVLVAEHHNR
jgi:hypothetical protein